MSGGMVAPRRAAAGADYVVDMQVLRAYANSSYLVASRLHSDESRAPFLQGLVTCLLWLLVALEPFFSGVQLYCRVHLNGMLYAIIAALTLQEHLTESACMIASY